MKLLTISLVSFLLLACGNSAPEMDIYADDTIAMREMSASIEEDLSPTQQNTNSQVAKKVIKTGQINFQSKSITEDYVKVKTLISSYDSYIDSENETNTDYQANYDITIRVNAKDYDSLFSQLVGLTKKLDFKSSNIEDVTAQYYDLKTRIKNKKALEQKYVSLLKRASTVKDLLEIERSINEVRNEIEIGEGSFRYLSKQIGYSTIQLNFYELLPSDYAEDGFWSKILHATGAGWKELLEFTVLIVQAWPFIILTGLSIFAYKRIRKSKLQKK